VNLLDRLNSAEEKRVLAEVRRFETFAGRAVDVRGLGAGRVTRSAR
jgi:hypothetical protein